MSLAALIGVVSASVLGVLCLLYVIIGPVIVKSDEVAIIEKKFSSKSLSNGAFIALNGEAGYQADILRAGLHFRCRIIYKIHKCPLITIKQGKIGYVFARSGESLDVDQTLGKHVECNTFQDTRMFLENGGQKGPQRTILREGTYAFNLAQFVIITEEETYFLPIGNRAENDEITDMANEIKRRDGFSPIVIDSSADSLGVIVTFEGKSLPSTEIIAPIVGNDSNNLETYHNSFQNIEAFLKAGGFKGRQEQVLIEGTYFINRLFATVEFARKTIIDVSMVGVVNAFAGQKGEDLSGAEYTHGELVQVGCRGIWEQPLSPGKYPLNPFACNVITVPTDNFALKWVSDSSGQYNYDEQLRELSVITKDGFQPLIPLSVVVHINYKDAPKMIQRFGSVKKLVEQTLDTIISAHFKQVAETKTFLELVQNKASIAKEVMERMKEEFKRFNLELEDVLIDTPKANNDPRITQLIEQLATRQLSKEQVQTYAAQMEASAKEKELKALQAKANQQEDLTRSQIQIEIKENDAEAKRKVAEKEAEQLRIETDATAYQTQKNAEVEANKIKILAEAESKKIKDIADAEAHKEKAVGEAIADASAKQVEAYGGANLLVQKEISLAFAKAIESGQVQIVPNNMITNGGEGQSNPLENLLSLMAISKLDSEDVFKQNTATKTEEAPVVEETKEEPNAADVVAEPQEEEIDLTKDLVSEAEMKQSENNESHSFIY